jgi:hypothetical protein
MRSDAFTLEPALQHRCGGVDPFAVGLIISFCLFYASIAYATSVEVRAPRPPSDRARVPRSRTVHAACRSPLTATCRGYFCWVRTP